MDVGAQAVFRVRRTDVDLLFPDQNRVRARRINRVSEAVDDSSARSQRVAYGLGVAGPEPLECLRQTVERRLRHRREERVYRILILREDRLCSRSSPQRSVLVSGRPKLCALPSEFRFRCALRRSVGLEIGIPRIRPTV
jgi:hypothetical protein